MIDKLELPTYNIFYLSTFYWPTAEVNIYLENNKNNVIVIYNYLLI